MQEQIAHLVITVSTDQVGNAQRQLDKLGLEAKRVESSMGGVSRASDGLSRMLLGLVASVVSVGTALAFVNKLVTTARTFEVLEAQLKTATGSAEDAVIAFNAIKQFATETPYDLAQATGAFIMLVNLGLNPSERAMRSYGNTASALNRELAEMANAVAKATTGEFEPLKGFGIKARREADEVVFTFRGMTERVKNNTKDIEDYFIRLGEVNFAGSMAERMKTLDGAISNLGDAWDQLFDTIAKQGPADLITQAIRLATDELGNLTAAIASGQLEGHLVALKNRFGSLFDDVGIGLRGISDLIAVEAQYWGKEGKSAADTISDAFTQMPENIAWAMEQVGIEIAAMVNQAELQQGILDSIGRARGALLGAGVTPESVGMHFNRFNPDEMYAAVDSGKLTEKQKEVLMTQVGLVEEAGRRAMGIADELDKQLTDNTIANLEKRDKRLREYADAKAAADEKRASYEAEARARKALQEFFGEDTLAKFGKGTTEKVSSEAQRNAFEALRNSLIEEELALQESYEKRKKMILDGTKDGSDEQLDLVRRLDKRYQEEVKKLAEDRLNNAGRNDLLDEEVRLQESYNRRLELIRKNTQEGSDIQIELERELNDRMAVEQIQASEAKASRLQEQYVAEQQILQDQYDNRLIQEEDFQDRSRENWQNYMDKLGAISVTGARMVTVKQLEMHSQVLQLAGNVSNQMSQLVQGNNAAAKAMFVAAKGIAMAQAVVNTELAATRALAEGGFYAGIPMASIIRGLGYASVALMGATAIQEYQGKFEHGGMIGAGREGLVGEAGPELVRGPAFVTSARTTADSFDGGAAQGQKMTVIINNNVAAASVEVEERQTSDGRVLAVLINETKKSLIGDVKTGGTPFTQALEGTYKTLRRAL
jgi:phage tail tape-measure protein